MNQRQADWTPTYEVVLDAVTFERNRLGEPLSMTKEQFDRWLAGIKHDAYWEGYGDGQDSMWTGD